MKKLILFISFLFFTNLMVSQTTTASEESVFTDVEVMPQFPGGEEAMKAFVHKNFKMPDAYKIVNFKGAAYVNVLVTKEGKLQDAKVVQSCGYDKLDKEVLRVISIMPAWAPGKDNGKPVNVSQYLNIEISQ